MAPGAEHRQVVVVAEQPVRDALHVQEVLHLRADAAEDPEDALHEQRRLHHAAVEEVRQRVQVPDVVALELESRALRRELVDDRLDVEERVLEDEVARHLQVRVLPLVLELRDAGGHREDPEVHAAHVQRAQLGLEAARGLEALVERHAVPAARRDVDDGVGAGEDLGQELAVDVRVGRRRAGLGVAGVEVQDRRAGLRGADRLLGDVLRRDGQVGRERGDVDRSRHRAADDRLALLSGHPVQTSAGTVGTGALMPARANCTT